jgi:hypothetical protein
LIENEKVQSGGEIDVGLAQLWVETDNGLVKFWAIRY